jgi:hypothetical protein
METTAPPPVSIAEEAPVDVTAESNVHTPT